MSKKSGEVGKKEIDFANDRFEKSEDLEMSEARQKVVERRGYGGFNGGNGGDVGANGFEPAGEEGPNLAVMGESDKRKNSGGNGG